jgi:DNA replication and repair protein RecF
MASGRGGDDELSVWNEMLVRKGAAVVRGRMEVLEEVLCHARELSSELVHNGEKLNIRYMCSFGNEGTDMECALGDAVRRSKESEIKRGYTLAGPHYDDVAIYLGDTDLKRYGSQGRRRLAAVILKLAQARTIIRRRTERPVVLLDDIFSELDEDTARRVRVTLSDRYQSFVTSPRVESFAPYGGGRRFVVEGGRFSGLEHNGNAE